MMNSDLGSLLRRVDPRNEAPTAHQGNDLSARKYSFEDFFIPFLVLDTYSATPVTSIAYPKKIMKSMVANFIGLDKVCSQY